MNIQDKTITDEVIEISDKAVFNAIGSNSCLDRCILKCLVPANSLDICGKIVNSRVIIGDSLKRFSWEDALIESCVFEGRLKDHSFGGFGGRRGICRNCDFSIADLDDCTFYGEESVSNMFPKWPNFAVFDPVAHMVEMMQHRVPDRLKYTVAAFEFAEPETTVIAFNAIALSKRTKESIDVIKNYFSSFSFVMT
jgi:hypothetical protein